MKSFGNGLFEEIVGDLSDIIRKMMKIFGIDTEVCLPRPSRVDLMCYAKIGTLILICWLLLIFEPIAMRFRTFVLHHHYPERGLQRTLWLYDRILKKRSLFFNFTKNRRRLSYHGDFEQHYQGTFLENAIKSSWKNLKEKIRR